jgi:phage terminase small subunit
MGLKAKRRKVVDSYMKCFNKKQAMLDAGYSMSMACTRANDVFKDPAVMAEIERRQNLASHRADVSLDWIVQRLKEIADANLGDALDVYSDGTANLNFKKFTPQLKRAMNKFSVTEHTTTRGENAGTVKQVRVNFSDQLKALELLVRHLGLSKEKQSLELSGDAELLDALHRGRSRAALEEDDG